MKQLDSDFDDSDELAKFFSLIRKYNQENDIDPDI
jgi:hypothetical protein